MENDYHSQENQIAIIKDEDSYISCDLNKKSNKNDKVMWVKTAQTGVYLYQHIYGRSGKTAKANAVMLTAGILEYSYECPKEELRQIYGDTLRDYRVIVELKMIKLYPSVEDIIKFSPASGTGFAISSNGYIATNNHVITGAESIKVRGINGDFSKTYKAKLIVTDKNNDLAIIKIDEEFSPLGPIPFIISAKSSDVGNSIFCLGYPLRSTMGDEVKLTNGIISSRSGFQGDITTYQISAPVQPGNSGGPLFDDKGTLIGIVNAKHLDAENVSYAIKSSYLLNLIDVMAKPPDLQSISMLENKSLSEQVKIIKNFIYIIETN